jgi:hypothetical protein
LNKINTTNLEASGDKSVFVFQRNYKEKENSNEIKNIIIQKSRNPWYLIIPVQME